MKTDIKEVEKPRISDLLGWQKQPDTDANKQAKGNNSANIMLVGSGKGAIYLVLKHLMKNKILENKLDEIMVADWVGNWVYNQIQAVAFPVKRYSERCKAIIVYHQYGFPQNMDKIMEYAQDKRLVVIEDCAHVLQSYYKNKLLGSFGDYSIYSYSKWFFCFALGGVWSKEESFYEYANKLQFATPLGLTLAKDLIKYWYERSCFSGWAAYKEYAHILLNMSYSFYGQALKPSRLALKAVNSKIASEINVRRKRYSHFRARTDHFTICDHLEKEGVIPYVIPVYCEEAKAEKLVNTLRDKGVNTGTYNFDINRNLLAPQFKKCVWIPCHRGISDDEFDEIIDAIVRTLN